jgi:hypothetical protein
VRTYDDGILGLEAWAGERVEATVVTEENRRGIQFVPHRELVCSIAVQFLTVTRKSSDH